MNSYQDDNNARLEQFYNLTWLCSKCGSRQNMNENYCPHCMEEALLLDEEKNI